MRSTTGMVLRIFLFEVEVVAELLAVLTLKCNTMMMVISAELT